MPECEVNDQASVRRRRGRRDSVVTDKTLTEPFEFGKHEGDQQPDDARRS
jgi:hypothetical protein